MATSLKPIKARWHVVTQRSRQLCWHWLVDFVYLVSERS